MILGFSGTRIGMNKPQRDAFRNYMLTHPIPDEFHHGDCIGADAQAHDILVEFRCPRIVVHPPTDEKNRAFKQGHEITSSYGYLMRNKHIVDACSTLIACPKGSEILRSGTWHAIRYARERGRIVHIIYPTGRVEVV